MANRGGIAVSTSRFACLAIDDDVQKENKPSSKTNPPSSASSSKKKNKKKKQQKETEELKNLAFGRPGKAKQPPSHGGDGDKKPNAKDWTQWQEHDAEHVEKQFKDDLEKALLESRVELERKEEETKLREQRIEAGLEFPDTKEGRKKKKQREKPQAMSLEQFKQLPPEKPAGSSDESDSEAASRVRVPPVQMRVPPTEQDSTFFNSVEDEAQHIINHEKVQEKYRKQFTSDNAIMAKFRDDLEKKDKKIAERDGQIVSMEDELKQVKKRNKQLCFILAQGEMKDKAEILKQVQSLTTVKDELTEQVTNLTAELEKEKSKNHILRAENDKLKASRHGK